MQPTKNPCGLVNDVIATQYAVYRKSDNFYQVDVPLVYSDGDHPVIYMQLLKKENDDIIRLQDGGNALMRLSFDNRDLIITDDYIWQHYGIHSNGQFLYIDIIDRQKPRNIDDHILEFGKKLLDIDNYKPR